MLCALAFVPVLATCACDDPKEPVDPVAPLALRVPPVPQDLGDRAYQQVAKIVGLGPRHSGTKGWEEGLDYIESHLRGLGLDPVRDRWVDPFERMTFENLSCRIPGRLSDTIVIGCHHDTKIMEGHSDPKHNFPFVGANDSGSGVGLILALAEVLVEHPVDPTIELAFFDGEESLSFHWDQSRALFGSRRYVARYRAQGDGVPTIHAMICLDMVGAVHLSLDDELYSDPELKRIVYESAEALGTEDVLFARSRRIGDDHLPFVQAGIRSIDLIDVLDNPEWHTPNDTMEHIRAESLQTVGAMVLHALPAIAAETIPSLRGGVVHR